jgi:serine/threonine protein kinase
MKELGKKILSKALKYNPKERPTIKELVDYIKDFEGINNIKTKNHNTSTFIKLFSILPLYKKDSLL